MHTNTLGASTNAARGVSPAQADPTSAAVHLPTFMARDLRAQVQWLASRAQAYGYADVDELFGRAPAVYTQLAVQWRQTHPLPAMA